MRPFNNILIEQLFTLLHPDMAELSGRLGEDAFRNAAASTYQNNDEFRIKVHEAYWRLVESAEFHELGMCRDKLRKLDMVRKMYGRQDSFARILTGEDECPLCEAHDRLDQQRKKIEELGGENDKLKDQISGLEGTIKDLIKENGDLNKQIFERERGIR